MHKINDNDFSIEPSMFKLLFDTSVRTGLEVYFDEAKFTTSIVGGQLLLIRSFT
jgi:hypothetical protein